MTTMFIDTNGEMSFVDNERLKFIMHYLKQGADDSLVKMKDGRFVREDSELSFTEIWLPAAEHQQRKIDEQQAKVEELEKEWLEMNQQHEQAVKECFEVNAENRKLQKRVNSLIEIAEELLEEMKYPTCTFEEVIVSGVKLLEQALKWKETDPVINPKDVANVLSFGASVSCVIVPEEPTK